VDLAQGQRRENPLRWGTVLLLLAGCALCDFGDGLLKASTFLGEDRRTDDELQNREQVLSIGSGPALRSPKGIP
jgi:hypothetical protein